MSDEIAVRAASAPVPAVDWYGDVLGRYIWVNAVSVDAWQGSLRIDGLLKPDPDAADVAALRRSFLDSLDAVMRILEAAGVTWAQHPDVQISGMAQHRIDGGQEFARMECRVEMYLLGVR